MTDTWQPIKTAPKGQKVLIYIQNVGAYAWTNHSDENQWPDGTTHWMPLPKPPKRRKK